MKKAMISIVVVCTLLLTLICFHQCYIKKEGDSTTLLLLDTKTNRIELLNTSATKLTEDTVIKKFVNGEVVEASLSDLYIGMNNLYVKTNGDVIETILIDNEPIFNRLRVAIRKSLSNLGKSGLYHDTVIVEFSSDTKIKTFDGEKEWKVSSGDSIEFYVNNNEITFKIGNKVNSSSKRIIIEEGTSPLKITSITRNSNLLYEGKLDLSLVNEKILVVNDILMEDYLKKVVPSEMISSWNMEALKAQAIAARTFAYKAIYNKSYRASGYVVDDSTNDQVYNNISEQTRTNQAVLDTKGLVMFYNNKPITAYFYSGDGGLRGNANEVWITNKVTSDIPYLHGGNETNMSVDVTNESSVLNFYKTINMTATGGASSNFRWLVTMNKQQLRQTLNANVPSSGSKSFPILENGSWLTKAFPSDIGTISNIFVSERGSSGVVVSVQVVAANVTFRVYGQSNLRSTFAPGDCGSSVTTYYTKANTTTYDYSSTSVSSLKSGYFALEWNGDNLSFYGGGSGHGVGLSQYGANYYANQGQSYTQILNRYYTGVTYVDTFKEYTPLRNYKDYL